MPLRITPFLIIFLILSTLSTASAKIEDSFAFKLAALHIKNENPEKVLLEGNVEPPSSIVYEFQWILDSMKSRCINTEETIASTIVKTWTLVQRHKDLNILETARALSLNAQNKVLFGRRKVNFMLTSQYWLTQQISK